LSIADFGIPNDQLQKIVDDSLLTPLGILYLFGEMDRRTFPREAEATWNAVKQPILRNLPVRFFQDKLVRLQASERTGKGIPSGAVELVPSLCDFVLRKRYPEYSTLIRQPKWESKIKDYINSLNNQNIPLACKRGREAWRAPKNEVANVFSTNVMNLSDLFSGYENLISINMGRSRDDDAAVQFKIHPLEEKIMDAITAEKPAGKLKIDGKECWWVDIHELIPMLLYSGYQLDEIMQIVDMGKARGTFLKTKHKGCPVLYCKPIDPEQMKAQLCEKLASLKEEFDELKKLPGFRHSFDFESIESKIETIADDADFESLKSQIHRAFEQNHDRLNGFFDRLIESLENESASAQQIKTKLKNSRQVIRLQATPTASSKWCSDLSKFIVANLSATVEEIKRECNNIKQKVAKASHEYASNKKGRPIDKIKRLQGGWAAHSSIKEQIKDIQTSAKQLMKQLDDYGQWRKLLSRSDDIYQQLLEMKKDDAHKVKSSEFLDQTDKLWDDISHWLQTRNVNGLGSYKQFFKQFDEIDNSRKKYLQELRGAFEKKKDKVNTVLKDIGLGYDRRVNIVFNPDNSQGCYVDLFRKAFELQKRMVQDEAEELSNRRLEILYAKNVTKRVSEENVNPALNSIEACSADLEEILSDISAEWFEEASKNDGQPQPEISEIKKIIEKTREAAREARKIIVQKGQAEEKKAKITKEAQEMLELIPDNEVVNLKQLILKMMKEEQPATDILDPALKNLSELFRNDKVQIKVELPRK